MTAAYEQARIALNAAAADIASMPKGEERSHRLRYLAGLLAGQPEVDGAQALSQCLDLAGAVPLTDAFLEATEQALVACLTPSDLEVIDATLIASSASFWQKVARVVGAALITLNPQFPQVPHPFYVQRIAILVQRGQLLAQGNLDYMRLGEVRLSAAGTRAA